MIYLLILSISQYFTVDTNRDPTAFINEFTQYITYDANILNPFNIKGGIRKFRITLIEIIEVFIKFNL